jgi:hypothetical protein
MSTPGQPSSRKTEQVACAPQAWLLATLLVASLLLAVTAVQVQLVLAFTCAQAVCKPACLPGLCDYKLNLGSVWSEVLHTGKSQGHFYVADFYKCLQTHSTVTGFLCSKYTEYALDK